jgi:threonine aldolase
MKGFASDNYAGVIPEALAAIAAANEDHAPGYGADRWTAAARALVREAFEAPRAEVFLVFNGTAANVLAVEALTRPWESVITTRLSHMHVDECGAPEAVGIKLLTAPCGPDGKLAPEDAAALVQRIGDEHATQPRVVSVAQTTEMGGVLQERELAALRALCDEHDLRLHVDGARLFAAAAARGCSLAQAAAGADAVSLGGTKAGLMGVEAVVLLDPDDADGFAFRRKRRGQLASKMRFAAAQLTALLADGTWRGYAEHANAMAARLHDAVRGLPGVQVTTYGGANALFAVLDPQVTAALQERFPFYVWDEGTGEVRWMTSWDTRPDEVDAFAAAVAALAATAAPA